MRLEDEYSENRRREHPNRNHAQTGKGKKRRRRKRGYHPVLIVLLFITVLLIIPYLCGVVYYSGHYAPGTEINAEPCGKKTVGQMQKQVTSKSSGYTIQVYGRGDVSDVIYSVDIGLSPKFDGEFEDILKKQNALLWPMYYTGKTRSYTTDTVVDYNRQYLDSLIDNLSFFQAKNLVAPQNAYLSDEAGANGYEIIPDTPGTLPIRDKVHKEIEAAIDVLADEVILSDDCYETAEITADDPSLVEERDRLNEFCNVNITYQFGEDQIVVDGNRVREWLKVEGEDFSLDEGAVRKFVDQLARTYDTFGKSREIKTHSGETITVSGGDFGWWMDRVTETQQLCEAIRNHESGQREPVYFGRGITYGSSDLGDTYVEINLTDQHLWVYVDGQVVEESDFVSGNVTKGNGTPTGTYSITYKERDATLKGENYTSAVSYWMPFNGNVGMHDASWRDDFGGELYLTSGSHGCINLPKKKAEAIYDIVKKGEPVVVYGGKTEAPASPEAATQEQIDLINQLIEEGKLNPDGSVPGTEAQNEEPEVVETEENPLPVNEETE